MALTDRKVFLRSVAKRDGPRYRAISGRGSKTYHVGQQQENLISIQHLGRLPLPAERHMEGHELVGFLGVRAEGKGGVGVGDFVLEGVFDPAVDPPRGQDLIAAAERDVVLTDGGGCDHASMADRIRW